MSRSHPRLENNLDCGNSKMYKLSLSRPKEALPSTVKKQYTVQNRYQTQLIQICVGPIITYGYQLWPAAAKTHINEILKIQHEFLRIILNKTYDTPIREIQHAANI